VDPNKEEFGPDYSLCPMCKLKLGNFTEALGIPAGKVFTEMNRNQVQKTRIEIKNRNVPVNLNGHPYLLIKKT
jgi:hypothetical protein